MRILVAGDVHRRSSWFAHLCDVARQEDADVILQVGDFGYWEHRPAGVTFLDDVTTELARLGRPCVFIDGNHENHALLRSSYAAAPDGFVPVREGLFYAPRGLRWTWDGVSFLALGGAYSVDQWMRTPGTSWWPEETITDDEVAAAIGGGPVDVLVSHDCPDGLIPPRSAAEGAAEAPRSAAHARFQRLAEGVQHAQAHRVTVRGVVDAVHPQLVLHGHYHHRHTSTLTLDDGTHVRIEGLGRDNQGPDGWMVLDTTSISVAPPALSAGGATKNR